MQDKIKEEYFKLLRCKSVGVDPSCLRECTQCATLWREILEAVGFKSELILPKEGEWKFAPPIVYAERPGDEGAMTVLWYGHYDVQPADPIEEWKSDPFEPTERDGRIYCRGAQDDKGQSYAFFCGIRDFLSEAKGPKPTIKVILDGQEESGSGALMDLASSLRRKIAADVLLVCDTSAAADLRPAVVAGMRGVGHFTVRLTGPNRDLHSGEYGGIAPNPAQGMAELIATLHNPDGSIAVAGFREGIEPPTDAERRAAEGGLPDEKWYCEDIGCEPVGGQQGKTIAQRNAFEPTIEVNGIHTGFGGVGAKTVIPSTAIAKLSMRFVPGQSPRVAFDAVRKHLEDRCPRGLTLSIEECNPGSPALRLPLSSPIFRLAEDVLSEMDPRGCVYQWDGASLPVISVLRQASGAAPLIVGWGQSEDRIHSPNESYSLVQFEKAREWGKKIFSAL